MKYIKDWRRRASPAWNHTTEEKDGSRKENRRFAFRETKKYRLGKGRPKMDEKSGVRRDGNHRSRIVVMDCTKQCKFFLWKSPQFIEWE